MKRPVLIRISCSVLGKVSLLVDLCWRHGKQPFGQCNYGFISNILDRAQGKRAFGKLLFLIECWHNNRRRGQYETMVFPFRIVRAVIGETEPERLPSIFGRSHGNRADCSAE